MATPTLLTIGYGMHSPPKGSRAELLRTCLEDASASLLLDVRDSPWGGFWNPKRLQQLFAESPVDYLFRDEERDWHKLFGASRKIRSIVLDDWQTFREAYTQELFEKDPDALSHLLVLLQKHQRVAIMCCEPYVPTHDNCHRFILAALMREKELLTPSQIVHLNLDSMK